MIESFSLGYCMMLMHNDYIWGRKWDNKIDEFDKFFDDVMKDENIITFQDIAYAPYNKPKIYIL